MPKRMRSSWAGDYQAGLAEDLKGLGADYQRQGAEAEALATEADKKAAQAKERLERLANGEDVSGGLLPFTYENAIKVA